MAIGYDPQGLRGGVNDSLINFRTKMKRVLRSLVFSFLFLASGLLADVRGLWAGEGTESDSALAPNVMRMDIEGWTVVNFKEMVILPLLAIGIVSYLLAYWYKNKKWTMGALNHIRLIGNISTIVCIAALVVEVFIEMNRSGDSFHYTMASWTVPLLGFYFVSSVIMLAASIYSLEYIWRLIRKDLPLRKK